MSFFRARATQITASWNIARNSHRFELECTFEYSTRVLVAHEYTGTEILHSTSCSPLCPDGEIPSEQTMFCNEGVLTPSNFQCEEYIKVGDGTLATFATIISIVNLVQEDLQNANPSTLPSHLEEFDRECVRQCIGTTNCNAVSRVTRVPEESASCMLFSEPATAASLDKYVVFECELTTVLNALTRVTYIIFLSYHSPRIILSYHIQCFLLRTMRVECYEILDSHLAPRTQVHLKLGHTQRR